MQRSFTFILLLVVCFAVIGSVAAQDAPTPEPVGLRPDAPQYALHGPYWVGTHSFSARAPTHPTHLQLWYPALNLVGEEESLIYSGNIRVQGHALRDAEPNAADGPYPLVIFAHGSSSVRYASAFLTEHLASQGFVVLAMDYQDNVSSASGIEPSMLTRPQDVSWQIDLAQDLTTSGEEGMENMIDTERVAVVGHSFGAYTALMAAGAQLDFSSPTSACQIYPDLTFLPLDSRTLSEQCLDIVGKLVDLLELENAPDGLWPSWGDPRVDAIVPMAADMTNFGADSTGGITAPTLLMVSTGDRLVYPNLPLYQPYLFDTLSSDQKATLRFEAADHMIYGSDCDAAPDLYPDAFRWCSDPVWDMDRAHDLINHFTTAFLLSTLKGDAEATAALAPDAVSFPGIAYQAEGF